jgi:hypothetical protein
VKPMSFSASGTSASGTAKCCSPGRVGDRINHPTAIIGSRTNMRSLRWYGFAAGYAGELADKSLVFHPHPR